MKILKTQEIESFLDRCLSNIQNDTKNQFLDLFVTEENEAYIKKKMKKAGFPDSSDSLFLSVDEWENTPYHKTIHLNKVQNEHFTYTTEWMAGNQLFNSNTIQKDPNKELNDYMLLKAMDRDFQAVFLLQDGKDWMLDAPSEAFTNDPIAKKSHGNVVTFGLGIGYYLFMACQNPNVKSITVVEKSKNVIDLFQSCILPQFNTDKKIAFINEDAYKLWNSDILSSFDTIYADIWQSSNDGLYCITKFLELYIPPFDSTYFWIEDSCLEIMWTLSLLHFVELTRNKKMNVASNLTIYMNKIRSYYSKQSQTINDLNTLKHLMYDTKTIREILSQK